MTFTEMLRALLLDGVYTQAEIAKSLGISAAYVSDLLAGHRLPSVRLVNRICEYIGPLHGSPREWHLAGAAAHGWEVHP